MLSSNVDEKKLQAAFSALDDLWDASGGSDSVAYEMADDMVISIFIRLLQPSSYFAITNIDEIREIAGSVSSPTILLSLSKFHTCSQHSGEYI